MSPLRHIKRTISELTSQINFAIHDFSYFCKKCKKEILFSVLALCFFNHSLAQDRVIFEEWTSKNGIQNMYIKSSSCIDANNDIYIAGSSLNQYGNYDILVSKYNAKGDSLWTLNYSDVYGDDFAAEIIFAQDILYLVGASYSGMNAGMDLVLIQCSTEGDTLWTRKYNGLNSLDDYGTRVVAQGNEIYVCGSSLTSNTLSNFIVAKFDEMGNLLWEQNWNGSNDLNDVATSLCLSQNELVVAGGSQINSTKWEYAVLNLNPGNGNILNIRVSNTNGAGINIVKDLVVDSIGNIYITGGCANLSGLNDINTIKLDSSLTVLWDELYNGGDGLHDVGQGITIDSQGNVYVAGFTTSADSGKNFIVLKYNSTGILQWDKSLGSKLDDEAKDILLTTL